MQYTLPKQILPKDSLIIEDMIHMTILAGLGGKIHERRVEESESPILLVE
jgi:hypothetical protein